MQFKTKKFKAFTLTELLVALAIIGVLILLALPKLSTFITKAKSLEAQKGLEMIYELQKSNYYIHNTYSNDLRQIDFEMEGDNQNYLFEIVQASPSTFLARATAKKDFDNDGQINVWEINHEKQLIEVTKD